MEPGLQKEVGALHGVRQPPCVPTRGRPAHTEGSPPGRARLVPRSAPGNQDSASRLGPTSRRSQFLCSPIFKPSLSGTRCGGPVPRSRVFPSPCIRRQQEHPCRGEDESWAPAPDAGGPRVRVQGCLGASSGPSLKPSVPDRPSAHSLSPGPWLSASRKGRH